MMTSLSAVATISDVSSTFVDNSKLRALGWKPKINLNQGIKETLEYFKSEKIN